MGFFLLVQGVGMGGSEVAGGFQVAWAAQSTSVLGAASGA